MEPQKLDPKQVDALLEAAGKKLGVPPQQLRKELESGKFDPLLRNLNQKDSAKVQKVLQDPSLLEKVMQSPQAKALYRKLSGN